MIPRIVLDTNVLVSGTLWSGSPTQVLDVIYGDRVELVLSPSIVHEYSTVLNRPEFKPRILRLDVSIERLLHELLTRSVFVKDTKSPQLISADPSDEMFLAAAFAGRADAIISGDKHLLDLKDSVGIPILTPAQFLKRFKVRLN